jgi:DNA-binding transcriptional MerR regulator
MLRFGKVSRQPLALDFSPWTKLKIFLVNVTTPKLILIAEFSKRTKLSGKALRLYDTMGLLEPVSKDPQSGYRYYSEDQLERATRISLLRQLEMPLPIISEILDLEGRQAVEALTKYWREVERSHKEKRGLKSYLEHIFEGKDIPMFDVKTRYLEGNKVATIAKTVFQPELEAFITGSFVQIHEHISYSKLIATMPQWVIFYGPVTPDSASTVEVCVPFVGVLEPTAQIAIKFEPAHQEAFVRLTKDEMEFPGILHAYDAVAGWLKENNKTCSSLSSREVYFADWLTTAGHEPLCDITFPY